MLRRIDTRGTEIFQNLEELLGLSTGNQHPRVPTNSMVLPPDEEMQHGWHNIRFDVTRWWT